MKCKHIITYIGNGIYTDNENKEWKKGKSREYETDKDSIEFLEERSDLKFMVEYGTMQINSMSIGAKAPSNKSEIKDNTEKKTTNISETKTQNDSKKTEEVKVVKAK